jgi:hypothetical protein
MKRILTVLALLTVCGMAFSVTGALYVRYNADNTITATEWSGSAGSSIDDLRVGRRGSGFDINTDTFGVSYKIRTKNVAGTGYANGVFQTVGAFDVTSPGYLQITGIKLGGFSADLGGSWWTAGLSKVDLKTNMTTGVTNNNTAINYGVNHFALNLDFNLPIGDKLSIQAYPWDKIQFNWIGGSATKTDVALTNNGTTSLYDLILPIHFDLNGMDPISLGIFPKFEIKGVNDTYNTLATTNVDNVSELRASAMIRFGYKINSVWGVYAHVGIDNDSTTTINTTAVSTNTENNNQLFAPLWVGVSFAPAGWVKMNIGVGYNWSLASKDIKVSQAAGINTTNFINTTGSGMQSTYGWFDEHAYQTPFLQFSGSSKFATDWELGLNTTVAMNGGAMGGNYPAASGTTKDGYVNVSQGLTWENDFNWDNNCYLKYTKDAVSLTGVFGNKQSGTSTATTAIGGIFGFVDMSISY